MQIDGLQDQAIQKALGATYCKMQQYAAIGKENEALEVQFLKLCIMVSISPYVGASAVFQCYLNTLC